MPIREAACRFLSRRLRNRLKNFDTADWTASAVIFAPHPDDETLGCGGVLCKKIASGAELRFVFVTDGTCSHRGQIAPEELCRQRKAEALEAVRRLGASASAVTFLDFPDGRASDHVEAITERATALLHAWRPKSAFVIHAQDPSSDHAAVHRGVVQALKAYGMPVTVYEYPVWYWYHWPWVSFGGDLPGMWRRTARQTISTVAGLRALSTLNAATDISDVLGVKRAALEAHRSQTVRPAGHANWPILSDLANGDFIKRLLADYEVFTRYELNA